VGVTRAGGLSRALLDQPARAAAHRLRCRRTVVASRRITARHSQTKTRRSIPTVGAAIRPGGRSAGNCCPSGFGTRLLELGHQLEPIPLRTTEFAFALPPQSEQTATSPASSAPASAYSPPTTATSFKTGRFTGADFPHEGDGTLRCPAGQSLTAHEWRRARRWQPARGLWGQPS